jgi:hypothetical protein
MALEIIYASGICIKPFGTNNTTYKAYSVSRLELNTRLPSVTLKLMPGLVIGLILSTPKSPLIINS